MSENQARTWAVLLAKPGAFKPEQIAQVLADFREAPRLDVMGPARRCRGILVEGLEPSAAQALVAACAKVGIEAVAVADARLLSPPPSKVVRSLDFDKGSIRLEDGAQIPWDQVAVIMAAGLERTIVSRLETSLGPIVGEMGGAAIEMMAGMVAGAALGGALGVAVDLKFDIKSELTKERKISSFRETSEPCYFLGLVTEAPIRHLWIDAQRFNYSCLKELKAINVLMNFRALTAEAIQLAPQATLSVGADAIKHNRPMKDIVYGSPQEIQREYRWLLTLRSLK